MSVRSLWFALSFRSDISIVARISCIRLCENHLDMTVGSWCWEKMNLCSGFNWLYSSIYLILCEIMFHQCVCVLFNKYSPQNELSDTERERERESKAMLLTPCKLLGVFLLCSGIIYIKTRYLLRISIEGWLHWIRNHISIYQYDGLITAILFIYKI